jgi:hypothetical protein
MLAILKLGCLVLYALGAAGALGWLRGPLATGAEIGAVLFLAIHVIELPFFLRVLRTYRGSLASSVLQALLFGALHSAPLMRAARA